MLSINTNLSSLITQRSMFQSTTSLNQAIERMTTGYKINHAKDNAANYNIVTNMTTKIGALQVAEDNASMGLDLISTAEESLSLIEERLIRLRDLATQASNGTYGEKSLKAINTEVNAHIDEINRLYSNTEYNGTRLFCLKDYENAESIDFDEAKRVSKQTSFVSGEIYYITDSDDLVALQNLVDSGISTIGVNFELVSNINMQGVVFGGIGDYNNPFRGTFDGNNFSIENLTIVEPDSECLGLISYASYAEIKNLNLKNCDIQEGCKIGGIAGRLDYSILSNCYVSGKITAAAYWLNNPQEAGGIVGFANFSEIKNSMVECEVNGYRAGGFVGYMNGGSIDKCYSKSKVVANSYCGGFAAVLSSATISNCYSAPISLSVPYLKWQAGFSADIMNSVVNNCAVVGTFAHRLTSTSSGNNNITTSSTPLKEGDVGTIGLETCSGDDFTLNLLEIGFTEENGWKMVDNKPILTWVLENLYPTEEKGKPGTMTMLVGSGYGESSQINLTMGLVLEGIDDLRNIGLDENSYQIQIDSLLLACSERATQYGAMQNRLNSALEEISTQYENLVSSRSTLQDADIAEVSSEYIRQQILQQASATLMSTANQSASIALSLI